MNKIFTIKTKRENEYCVCHIMADNNHNLWRRMNWKKDNRIQWQRRLGFEFDFSNIFGTEEKQVEAVFNSTEK